MKKSMILFLMFCTVCGAFSQPIPPQYHYDSLANIVIDLTPFKKELVKEENVINSINAYLAQFKGQKFFWLPVSEREKEGRKKSPNEKIWPNDKLRNKYYTIIDISAICGFSPLTQKYRLDKILFSLQPEKGNPILTEAGIEQVEANFNKLNPRILSIGYCEKSKLLLENEVITYYEVDQEECIKRAYMDQVTMMGIYPSPYSAWYYKDLELIETFNKRIPYAILEDNVGHRISVRFSDLYYLFEQDFSPCYHFVTSSMQPIFDSNNAARIAKIEKERADSIAVIEKRRADSIEFWQTLTAKREEGLKGEEKIRQENAKKKEEEKKSIIKRFGERYGNAILQKYILIGMTEEMCRLSWGEPNDINTTITQYGIYEQWVYEVYEFKYRYIYLENGKVTGIDY